MSDKYNNQPQPATASHSQPQTATASHSQPQPATASWQPQTAAASHSQPQDIQKGSCGDPSQRGRKSEKIQAVEIVMVSI